MLYLFGEKDSFSYAFIMCRCNNHFAAQIANHDKRIKKCKWSSELIEEWKSASIRLYYLLKGCISGVNIIQCVNMMSILLTTKQLKIGNALVFDEMTVQSLKDLTSTPCDAAADEIEHAETMNQWRSNSHNRAALINKAQSYYNYNKEHVIMSQEHHNHHHQSMI